MSILCRQFFFNTFKQIITSRESVIFDFCHTIWYRYTFQTSTTFESTLSDFR